MYRRNKEKISYQNDDRSRYSSPEYLDKVSLSYAESKGPKGYRRPDGRIYEDVCEALLNDRFIDASDIDVEVHEGIVSLRGAVESRRMKKEAEFCIDNIFGVVDVFNLLNIYQFREAGGVGLVKNQARFEQ
jgi:osmotically-inducible protein OsmY